MFQKHGFNTLTSQVT